jgi:hypothetical protein
LFAQNTSETKKKKKKKKTSHMCRGQDIHQKQTRKMVKKNVLIKNKGSR